MTVSHLVHNGCVHDFGTNPTNLCRPVLVYMRRQDNMYRDRASDGTFLPRAPVFAVAPRAPPRHRHAYETITDAVGAFNEDLFLPCIWEAKSAPPPGVRRYDRLWRQNKPWRWNVQHLLNIVAGLLESQVYFNQYDQALVRYQPLRTVFAEPLSALQCMPIHRRMVSKRKYVYMNRTGYVQLTLFYQGGREVRINAHLFILWAVKGMPQAEEHTHAVHICPNALEDPACVQPEHLEWATPSENAEDHQRRLHQWSLAHSPRCNLHRRHR